MAGEGSKEYGAFRIFRDMPVVQRSVSKCADEASISKRHGYDLAKEWCWQDRCDAWDAACHHIEDQERLEAIRQMHKVHRSAGRLAVGKAMQALQQLPTDMMNAGQIARLLALGAKLERDTLTVSVEDLQGIEDYDETDDPWAAISRELTGDGADDTEVDERP